MTAVAAPSRLHRLVEPEVAAFAEAAPHLGGPGVATFLATGARTSPYAAALTNGQAAVRLELDGSGFGGKHSIPYSTAVRLLLGHNDIAAYTDEVAADPAVHDLMARVQVVEDPFLTRLAPAVRAARVAVRLRDGRTLTAQEDRAPGGYDRPYDAATLRAKHEQLLGPAAADVLGWCEALPRAASVRGLDRLVS
jgi:2-methylcitrate dehydratase PrpD